MIADDEPLAVERLQILCPDRGAAWSARRRRRRRAAADRALTPDLLLLDIQMPGMDGMAVRARWRLARGRLDFRHRLRSVAVAAFDVAAVDYLLPVEAERLERAIARVRTHSRLGAVRASSP